MQSESSARERLIAAVIGFVLVAVLMYPTVAMMGRVGRFDTGDGRYSIWNVAWVAHALVTDPRHVLDANIFVPHTGTLAYSELNLPAGLMGAPAYLVTGNPLTANNFAILVALWLSFFCMWALVRRLTGASWAGLVSGAIFAFCPYLLSHTAHVQLLMAFVVPLNFIALHRLVERPSVGRGVALGLAVGVGGLASGYYGIYGGVALGVGALWFGSRTRAYWTALSTALATAAIVTLPVLIPFRAARAAVGGGPTTPDTELAYYSAQPIDLLVSGARAHQSWQPDNFSGRDPLFPGIIALGLLVWLGVRWASGRRADLSARVVAGYLVVGLFGLWAVFGPKAGLYLVLDRALPPMDFLRAPARFGIVMMFGISALAGMAVASTSRRWWLAAILTLGVAAESGAQTAEWGWPSWPVRAAAPVPEAYRRLATLPRGAVVSYPFPYQPRDFPNHTNAMMASMYSWQPFVNGYSDIIPQDFAAIALPINAFPDPESFAIMRAHQVRYVLWHMSTYNAESRARLLARFPPYADVLKPIINTGDVWLYQIGKYPD